MCHLLIHVVAGHKTARSRHLRDRASEHSTKEPTTERTPSTLQEHARLRTCQTGLRHFVSFWCNIERKQSYNFQFLLPWPQNGAKPSVSVRVALTIRRLEGQRGPKRQERRMEAQGDPERPRRPRERPGKAQKRPREVRREANRGVATREGPERLRERFSGRLKV